MRPDLVITANCPTVPAPNSGTVGQHVTGAAVAGTDTGTISGTLSLKALAERVLSRDRGWDTGGDETDGEDSFTDSSRLSHCPISRRDRGTGRGFGVLPCRTREPAPSSGDPAASDAFAGWGVRRPPSWSERHTRPAGGCLCACCWGRRWWTDAHNAKGWCCWTCHPPTHLSAGTVIDIRS